MYRFVPSQTPFAFALLVGTAFAAAARAQTDSSTIDSVRYRAPDGSLVTITENERRSRMEDINEIIHDIGVGGKMLFDAGGELVVIETRRLENIALWLVLNGGLTPGQIPSWIDEQVDKAIRARDALAEELAAMKTATTITPAGQPPFNQTPPTLSPGTTAPAVPATSGVTWPDPMDWTKVKGEVHGTFHVECMAIKRTGVFRLALEGDQSVSSAFDDDVSNRHYTGFGRIFSDARANGQAQTGDPRDARLKWTAEFQRTGDKLVMSAYTLDLQPYPNTMLIDCKPGLMNPIPE